MIARLLVATLGSILAVAPIAGLAEAHEPPPRRSVFVAHRIDRALRAAHTTRARVAVLARVAEIERQARRRHARLVARYDAAQVGSGSGAPLHSPAPAAGPDVFWRLALCESGGGRYAVNPAGPYYSYFQWLLSTWHAYGGAGHPFDATYSEQLAIVVTMSPTHWPVCARRVGLL